MQHAGVRLVHGRTLLALPAVRRHAWASGTPAVSPRPPPARCKHAAANNLVQGLRRGARAVPAGLDDEQRAAGAARGGRLQLHLAAGNLHRHILLKHEGAVFRAQEESRGVNCVLAISLTSEPWRTAAVHAHAMPARTSETDPKPDRHAAWRRSRAAAAGTSPFSARR